MTNLAKQEADRATQKLLKKLSQITPPEKSANAWLVMENRLMAELRHKRPAARYAFRPVLWPALAAAACILLLAGAGLWFAGFQIKKAPDSLPMARIVQVQGEILCTWSSKHPDETVVWAPLTDPEPVKQNRIYRTSRNGRLSIQLDPGTGVNISENSRMTVRRADPQNIMLLLNQGRLLAKVSKRAPGQSFIVVTPNAVCEVVGTRFEESVAPQAGILTTSLSVLEGRVNLSSRYHKSVRRAVAAGRSAALSGEDMFFAREGESDLQKLEMDMADLSLPVESPGDAARPMGTLSITSDPPGAYTFINGRAVGRTPLVLEKPSDTYEIALALPGYAVYEQSLKVGRNKGAETHASLEKIKYLKFLKSIMVARGGLHEPVPQEKAGTPEPRVIPAVPIVSAAGGSPLAQSLFADAERRLESGDFGGALSAFEYLKSAESDNIGARLQIMDKIVRCYRALNNFSACVQVLDDMYRLSRNHVKKDNLLWEIADIRASRLGQYEAAEKDLLLYVKEYPGGFWIHEAYIKLAEIQYLLKKAEAAAATYAAYIGKYPQNRSVDKAYYNLAYILGHDLNDCGRALAWYRKLLAGHPQSPFVEDAVFWKADCLVRLNKKEEARAEYLNYLARFPNGRWKDATREKLADLAPQTAR